MPPFLFSKPLLILVALVLNMARMMLKIKMNFLRFQYKIKSDQPGKPNKFSSLKHQKKEKKHANKQIINKGQ